MEPSKQDVTIWKWVVGYEGEYMVSNNGDVVSVPRLVKTKGDGVKPHDGRTLKKLVTPNGYEQVALCHDGVVTHKSVHRIVAEAFIGDGEDMQVNHKNADKTDNRACNLEWCTAKENIAHSNANGLRSLAKNCRRVIRSDGQVFQSRHQAAKSSGTSPGNVWSVLEGKRKHANGFSFRYEQ